LFLHPYNETPWDDQVLHEPLALRTARATVSARATLLAGFTTVRDLGTEGAGYADVGLKQAIAQGIVPDRGCWWPRARWSRPAPMARAGSSRAWPCRWGRRRRTGRRSSPPRAARSARGRTW
jgi:hypothetical protein